MRAACPRPSPGRRSPSAPVSSPRGLRRPSARRSHGAGAGGPGLGRRSAAGGPGSAGRGGGFRPVPRPGGRPELQPGRHQEGLQAARPGMVRASPPPRALISPASLAPGRAGHGTHIHIHTVWFGVLSVDRARPLRSGERVTLPGGGISHLTWLSVPDETQLVVRVECRVFLVAQEAS